MDKFVLDIEDAIAARMAKASAKVSAAINAAVLDRPAIKAAGISALVRLVAIAQNDSGQSRICGRFLLGLYNGYDYPFNLTNLRGLDSDLHADCLAVLCLDQWPELEVHEYIEGGAAIWAEFRQRWGKGKDRINASGQQLYAEIKKSSKYAGQADLCRNSPHGYPFKVRIVDDECGYVVKGGIGGQYRIADLNLYVMQDGKKIRLH